MIELLSEYYARMTEQIFAYEGMLKEYVGDEILAIFGAPIEQPDHAEPERRFPHFRRCLGHACPRC